MKNWFWIPMAAIVGVIAGSWGPREDLESYKETVRAERSQKKVAGTAGFDAFARLANIPDVARRRPKVRPRTNEVARAEKLAETNAVNLARAKKSGENYPVLNNNHGSTAVWMASGGSREDLKVRIEEAAELWNTRVELSKTQWKDKLGIREDNASAAFDSAVATMNETLRDTMEAFAAEIEKAGKANPELGFRMMGDLSRNMAEAYDAIGAAVSPERRAEVSEIPVHEFIDPMVAEPLVGVQDKIEGGFMGHGGKR